MRDRFSILVFTKIFFFMKSKNMFKTLLIKTLFKNINLIFWLIFIFELFILLVFPTKACGSPISPITN